MRRELLRVGLVVAVALSTGCGKGEADASSPRVIILGFDGMDYGLTKRLMDEGRMPSFSRLARQGTFAPLGTSIPPESPVAWSNFITGMDAGGHGIFDFMHRDPKTMLPVFSTSRTVGAERTLKMGKWQIPLSSGQVELLRKGEPFWEELERHGMETRILRIPANFPPSGTATRELSGMGTPDLLGTYGTFSFYTDKPFTLQNTEIGGGQVYEVEVRDNVVEASLYGPDNPFLVEPEKTEVHFAVYIDPEEPVAELIVGEEKRVLQVGEWSDWVPLEFELIPTQSVRGMCRFYLMEARPDFKLYVSPVNIDPESPALPISTPESYAAELARTTGRFYTQGMPEDTNALDGGVFDDDDFIRQAEIAGEEVIHQYQYVLDHFKGGLLFYYFGNSDQVSHMLWRTLDPQHPAYDPVRDPKYGDVLPHLYERFDAVVGYTLERMGANTLLVVMSDHGFASWRRAFSLNTWLYKAGYLEVIDPDLEDDTGLFMNVDWSRTRAYGLGFASLYVNLKGREAWGIVAPEGKRALLEEIADKLKAVVDPATGKPVVANVYIAEDAYKDRGALDIGPDMILGWTKGTRCSDGSAVGQIPKEMFSDNRRRWSGDHLMDPEAVPGILLTSRPLKRPARRLEELAGAILAELGIERFPLREGASGRE